MNSVIDCSTRMSWYEVKRNCALRKANIKQPVEVTECPESTPWNSIIGWNHPPHPPPTRSKHPQLSFNKTKYDWMPTSDVDVRLVLGAAGPKRTPVCTPLHTCKNLTQWLNYLNFQRHAQLISKYVSMGVVLKHYYRQYYHCRKQMEHTKNQIQTNGT